MILTPALAQQRSDPTLLKKGVHTGNRVGISFENDGAIAGNSAGVDIRGEWPLGSGENYIGDMTPLIGIEFTSKTGLTLHNVTISRGPRSGQSDKKDPVTGAFRGWNPLPGYVNASGTTPAMSHLPNSWPPQGWADHPTWKDASGNVQWDGYFGRGVFNATQESYYVCDDQWDNQFSGIFSADSTDLSRHGMGLRMSVRGFQWGENVLAQDCLFWLYDIKNEGTTIYRKTDFGMIVGGCIGGDGDCGDDLGYFDVNESITYNWDNDGVGNKGQVTGWVGYAYLESPGNSKDGIDNDGDSPNPNSPYFTAADFDSLTYREGDICVLIDSITYERTPHVVKGPVDTVWSLGHRFVIVPGKTYFREGWSTIVNGVSTPDSSAYDGIDNDLDGLIDENQAVHYDARKVKGLNGVKYKDYIKYFKTGDVTYTGINDLMIDEKRDNDAGKLVTDYVKKSDGTVVQMLHWSGDENGNWTKETDDVGSDGIGPDDDGYTGPDADGTEGNGKPDQGEPNFGKLDIDESDQIGLTAFNFFSQAASPDMSKDEVLWGRMTPGKFDIIQPIPQDGDFIYSSGFFPLIPGETERFSIAVLFGADEADILRNRKVVQQIYNAGYQFPKAPKKPKITITEDNGKVIIYWNGKSTENSIDFTTKVKDFEGYKIYRSTDAQFQGSLTITNGYGVYKFYEPFAQYDLVDSVKGFFYPSKDLLEQLGGTTFYLGNNTGIVNKFVDSTVVKGIRYFYAVCAYDRGDEAKNIFPSENSKTIIQASTGEITTDDNTGYITPGARPAGYVNAKTTDLVKQDGFRATGSASVEIVDDKAIHGGNKYEITFQDTSVQAYTSSWSLLDLTTPDTVKIPSTGEVKIVSPGSSITVVKGDTVLVNGTKVKMDSTVYYATPDTLIDRSSIFTGNTPIMHGFRVQVSNDAAITVDSSQTKFSQTPSANFRTIAVQPLQGYDNGYNGYGLANDYQIEFYNSVVGNSVADTVQFFGFDDIKEPVPVTIKVKNLTSGKYVDFVFFKVVGTASTDYNLYLKENVDGKIYRTWNVVMKYLGNSPIESSGSYTFVTKKPFSHVDKYIFSMEAAKIDKGTAKTDMDKIKVVPNPYVVTHEGEPKLLSTQSSGRGERNIRFTHVPPGSKISIFTVRGEQIRTLHQDNLYVGDVYWNLRTEENLDVAFGVYIFVVDAPGIGTKTGKFALIK